MSLLYRLYLKFEGGSTIALIAYITIGLYISLLLFVVFRRYVLGKKPKKRIKFKESFAEKITKFIVGWIMLIFVGAMIATVGVAIYLPILGVAQPLACPNGEMELLRETYSYKPGQSGIAMTAYCINEIAGTQEEITSKAAFSAMFIYAAIGYVVFVMFAITRKWLLPGLWKLHEKSGSHN